MPRPSIRRPALEPYQRELAAMINDALNRGQRGDGTDERHWKRWTERGFADKASAAERSIANWRDPDKLSPPDDIQPLLKTFYGTIDRLKDERAKMERLWRLARGYLVDDEPGQQDWTIGKSPPNIQGSVNLVTLRVHAPVPWNDGTLRLSITLVITPDRDLAYRGQAVTIGLTEALLCMESAGLQPAWKSLPSQRGLKNFRLDAAGDRIVGPIDPDTGMIDGEPLEDGHFAVLEAAGSADGSTIIAVHAPRGGFRVLPRSEGHSTKRRVGRCSVNQTAVVNALLHEQLRGRDGHDRAIIASTAITPRSGNATNG